MDSSKVKAVAQQLSTEPYSGFLDLLIESFKRKWSEERLIKDNEFNTVVACAKRDGKIEGIEALRAEIEKIASN